MGYDMYLLGTPRPAMPDDERYHRKNIWGMRSIRDIMEKFEMAFWPEEDVPWPKERELDDDEQEKLHDLIDERMAGNVVEDASDDLIAIADRRVKHLGYRIPEGMSLGKFCSNDGWWVTAEECKLAVEVYDGVPLEERQKIWAHVAKGGGGWESDKPDEVREWFEDWVAFLRRGAEGRGFRVF